MLHLVNNIKGVYMKIIASRTEVLNAFAQNTLKDRPLFAKVLREMLEVQVDDLEGDTFTIRPHSLNKSVVVVDIVASNGDFIDRLDIKTQSMQEIWLALN